MILECRRCGAPARRAARARMISARDRAGGLRTSGVGGVSEPWRRPARAARDAVVDPRVHQSGARRIVALPTPALPLYPRSSAAPTGPPWEASPSSVYGAALLMRLGS